MESLIAQIHEELFAGIPKELVVEDRQSLLDAMEMKIHNNAVTLLLRPKIERHLHTIKQVYTRLAQMFSTDCKITPSIEGLLCTLVIQ
jgi:hypothetical protein